MTPTFAERRSTNQLTWLFLAAFAGSCLLFWWLESILLTLWLGLEDPIQARFLRISAGALVFFVAGYLLRVPKFPCPTLDSDVLDRCEAFSYKALLILSVPAFLAATQFAIYRMSVHYNQGHGLSLLQQAVLYTHLFFGLFYMGAVRDGRSKRDRTLLVAALTIAPRLLISLHWGRFFVAQAVVPIVFIAVARGWIRMSLTRIALLSLVALFIVLIPAITRGDKIFGKNEQGQPQIATYLGWMTTLNYFQDNTQLVYSCPPLLVSLTAKLIPYRALGTCIIDVGNEKGLPATLDRLLTKKYTDDVMKGTGANYLLELYLTGGIMTIMVGSAIFGFSCRAFVQLVGHRSAFAGIWAECLCRALFAPRGTLGYVYERIPSLLLATVVVIVLSSPFLRSRTSLFARNT